MSYATNFSPLAMVLGTAVGLSLGLTGGGGAIFAVPLLVYGLGVDPREAIGASLVTVGATALVGFIQRWRLGLVELQTGGLFAAAGMATAPFGAWLAVHISESLLMLLFAMLMVIVAVRMWRKARDAAERGVLVVNPDEPGPVCRRDREGALHWNSRCAVLLATVGLVTGILTGLFGVGGGFVIVPAFVLFSGMGIQRAVGTSLLVIALVSVSGTSSLIVAERALPWFVIAGFTTGSLVGLFVGSHLAARLGGPSLQRMFAAAIILVAAFIIIRNVAV